MPEFFARDHEVGVTKMQSDGSSVRVGGGNTAAYGTAVVLNFAYLHMFRQHASSTQRSVILREPGRRFGSMDIFSLMTSFRSIRLGFFCRSDDMGTRSGCATTTNTGGVFAVGGPLGFDDRGGWQGDYMRGREARTVECARFRTQVVDGGGDWWHEILRHTDTLKSDRMTECAFRTVECDTFKTCKGLFAIPENGCVMLRRFVSSERQGDTEALGGKKKRLSHDQGDELRSHSL